MKFNDDAAEKRKVIAVRLWNTRLKSEAEKNAKLGSSTSMNAQGKR